MASEVPKVVDPDNGGGTDYTSLDAWEDALGGTTSGHLPNDDQIAVAQCRNSSGNPDTAAVDIVGWTTDSTRYIKIEAYTGYRHVGVFDASKYHLALTDSTIITIQEDYVRIDGIQIFLTVTSGTSEGIFVTTASAANEKRFSNLIIKGDCTGTGGARGIRVTGDGNSIEKVWNCVIYDFISVSDSGDAGFQGINSAASVSFDMWNCTINNCAVGIREGSGGIITAINCLLFENNDDFSGPAAMTYCASDDDHTGDSVTNFVITQTADDYAALVVDADGGDYNVTDGSSELVGTGTDDPGGATQDDTDIAGNARTSTWDIGAFELVVAEPPVGMAGAMTTNSGYWGW